MPRIRKPKPSDETTDETLQSSASTETTLQTAASTETEMERGFLHVHAGGYRAMPPSFARLIKSRGLTDRVVRPASPATKH